MLEDAKCLDILPSVFDWFDKSIAIFDKTGLLLEINKHALDTYGIIDKKAFLAFKPNFFDSPSFKSSFDAKELSTKDITTRAYFDHTRFSQDFPGVSNRTGRSLHYLRIHPVFNKDEKMEFIVLFSTDLSTMKKGRMSTSSLHDILPVMMRAQGISTWTFDFESGKRILDAGSHLFPDLRYMEDFIGSLNPVDARILRNNISLIRYGNKVESMMILRFIDKAKDDEITYLETFCTPQIINHEVTGIFFLTKDVTFRENKQLEITIRDRKLKKEKAKLESANVMFHTLIDRIPCLFYAKDVDNDFKYYMANSLFCDHVGKKISKVIGYNDEEVIPSKDLLDNFHKSDITAIVKGIVSFTEETNMEGNKKVWKTTKYYTETTEGKRLVVGLSLEISDMYHAYEQAREAKSAAEKSDKMKNVFLQNVTHELITPLNSVLGFSQLLMDSSSEEEKALYGKEIVENGAIIKELLNEIIDLSQIESGIKTLKKETFDLCEYLRSIYKEYAACVPEKVEFKLDIPEEECMVTIDKGHLSKIIRRGIMNSIGFTFSGHITIGFNCETDYINIFVEDTGIGLSEEEMAAVTTHFENLTGFNESMAMSLSICKVLAKFLGAEIEITSSKGDISKTLLRIPTNR